MNTLHPLPELVVLDVNETLSDPAPLSARFAEAGLPADLAGRWFATLLRDGFALASAGGSRPFAAVGADALAGVLHAVGAPPASDRAVAHVLGGFAELPLHDDVAEGVRALRRTGARVVALTNGSRDVAERLLTGGGVRAEFEAVLSVEDAATWKPGPAAYRYGLQVCGVDAGDALMVAVHPWDVHGAAAVGMRTAWIDRDGAPYPTTSTRPDLRASSLVDLAAQLSARPAPEGPPADR